MRAIDRELLLAPASRRNLLRLALAAPTHRAESRRVGNPVRTLLLFGDRDPIAGRASEAELLRDLPNAAVERLAGAGHDLSLEKPVELAERVLRFLDA